MTTYGQWKSHYPEKKQNKKEVLSKEQKQDNNIYFNNLFFNGIKQKSLENYDVAIDLFQKCIDIKPNKIESYYQISLIKIIMAEMDIPKNSVMPKTAINKISLYKSKLINPKSAIKSAKTLQDKIVEPVLISSFSELPIKRPFISVIKFFDPGSKKFIRYSALHLLPK